MYDRVRQVAGEWVAKAEEDLKVAVHTLKLGPECPTSLVGFHAQQCVEKYLKAWLALKGEPFAKSHEIESLMEHVPPPARALSEAG